MEPFKFHCVQILTSEFFPEIQAELANLSKLPNLQNTAKIIIP